MERSLHYAQNQQCQSIEKRQLRVTWRERLYRWRQLRRERETLRHLSDDMLKDIGISREAVQRESRRPFWDDHGWRR
ncbi:MULTISPECIES: DUF1127 domain-containing protein [unclassified Halomonas]|uniref:DUF1127 domain-containing protein n=1 Tax=unclassified Halomonas TaxID=2609666 RepID=UPI0007DA1A96|nr:MULTISPECIES: DUF1127 domain-containing protein [unclassified Halomonas]MBT2787259.1 DUF1127 domain-containing protein [Halomonas sp. ISL-106]MBT2796377.1 DUF1127 domain-containing protein [Halomonas sp. ISL-104]MBT2801056.1 DUF1127 domain-containing protein [Halomonas sp. ISL-56]OAL57855.1 hypothetical protein A6R74_11925 [Halomonas sp. ALS9]